MRVRAGTSGYSYKEWKGSFYPDAIKSADMLGYYASKLSTVEINNTFYRMPKATMLENWARQVPDGFIFVIKAPRRITHMQRLKDSDAAGGDRTLWLSPPAPAGLRRFRVDSVGQPGQTSRVARSVHVFQARRRRHWPPPGRAF